MERQRIATSGVGGLVFINPRDDESYNDELDRPGEHPFDR